jgi:hypothetical protein
MSLALTTRRGRGQAASAIPAACHCRGKRADTDVMFESFQQSGVKEPNAAAPPSIGACRRAAASVAAAQRLLGGTMAAGCGGPYSWAPSPDGAGRGRPGQRCRWRTAGAPEGGARRRNPAAAARLGSWGGSRPGAALWPVRGRCTAGQHSPPPPPSNCWPNGCWEHWQGRWRRACTGSGATRDRPGWRQGGSRHWAFRRYPSGSEASADGVPFQSNIIICIPEFLAEATSAEESDQIRKMSSKYQASGTAGIAVKIHLYTT